MRENMGIYRGKRVDNGEWIEGNIVVGNCINKGNCYICPATNVVHLLDDDSFGFGCFYEVDPETVGEWTGMKDKNGKRIFEGDIVEEFCGVNGHRKQGAVYFNDLFLQFLFGDYNSLLKCSIYERKVIGNIYDNPELAKE